MRLLHGGSALLDTLKAHWPLLLAVGIGIAPLAVPARGSRRDRAWGSRLSLPALVFVVCCAYSVYAGPKDGRLTALFWELAQGPKDAYVPDETTVYRLPPGLIQEMPLVVNEGIASLVALFSIGGRPNSTPFSLPAEWRAELNQPRLLAQTVRRLEEELARRLAAEREK